MESCRHFIIILVVVVGEEESMFTLCLIWREVRTIDTLTKLLQGVYFYQKYDHNIPANDKTHVYLN